jgi:hypothetical protein
MIYKGSCHCGRISFEVEGDLAQAMECNCSHCSRKGYLLWFLPREKLRLKTPEADMATLHVQQARDPAPFLPELRLRAVRVRHEPIRRCDGGGERALSRGDRSRGTEAHSVRWSKQVRISR